MYAPTIYRRGLGDGTSVGPSQPAPSAVEGTPSTGLLANIQNALQGTVALPLVGSVPTTYVALGVVALAAMFFGGTRRR